MPVNILIFIISTVMFIAPSTVHAQEESSNSDKPSVQLFMNGKKYSSVEEYKFERLKQVAKKTFLEDKKDKFEVFLENVRLQLSNQNIEDFSVDDIRKIFEQLLVDNLKMTTDEIKNPTLEQMQSMLGDFYRKNKNAPSHEINPSKVKTIVINPSQ